MLQHARRYRNQVETSRNSETHRLQTSGRKTRREDAQPAEKTECLCPTARQSGRKKWPGWRRGLSLTIEQQFNIKLKPFKIEDDNGKYCPVQYYLGEIQYTHQI